jgi:transcriptional regulator with XRE-family HTH domain
MGLRPVDICRATGIKPSAYSQYESGRSRPNLDDMIRYAEAFHVTLDWIYRGDPAGLPMRIAREVLKSV